MARRFQCGINCDWKCHCDISKPLTHPMYWKIHISGRPAQLKSINQIKNFALVMPNHFNCDTMHMCHTLVRDISYQVYSINFNQISFHSVSLKMVSITAQWWDLIKITVCWANQIFDSIWIKVMYRLRKTERNIFQNWNQHVDRCNFKILSNIEKKKKRSMTETF